MCRWKGGARPQPKWKWTKKEEADKGSQGPLKNSVEKGNRRGPHAASPNCPGPRPHMCTWDALYNVRWCTYLLAS